MIQKGCVQSLVSSQLGANIEHLAFLVPLRFPAGLTNTHPADRRSAIQQTGSLRYAICSCAFRANHGVT